MPAGDEVMDDARRERSGESHDEDRREGGPEQQPALVREIG